MIYLAAATGTTTTLYRGRASRGKPLANPEVVDVRQLWDRPDTGVMVTPLTGPRVQLVERAAYFGVDTGLFTRVGAARYSDCGYLALLEELLPYRAKCLFATAPDVPESHDATLRRSLPMLREIRAMGLPAAFVGQDGGATETVPWDQFDVLFIGGSTAWKLTAGYDLAVEGKRRRRWTHMGRCNSWQRIRAATVGGYDSADGTCLRFNPPQYVREIAGWLDRLKAQPPLPIFTSGGAA